MLSCDQHGQRNLFLTCVLFHAQRSMRRKQARTGTYFTNGMLTVYVNLTHDNVRNLFS